jgi:hypothetical protein
MGERRVLRPRGDPGVSGLALSLDVGQGERVGFDRLGADLRGRYDGGVVDGCFTGVG